MKMNLENGVLRIMIGVFFLINVKVLMPLKLTVQLMDMNVVVDAVLLITQMESNGVLKMTTGIVF